MVFYEQYQQGLYQEVYQELLSLKELIFLESIYEDAFLVVREIMKRVRFNLDILIPRLYQMNYQFGENIWGTKTLEEKELDERFFPIYRAPDAHVKEQIDHLERLVGILPLSLKCWYEEVGGVNLVGMFSLVGSQDELRRYGCILDPLLIMPLESVIVMVTQILENDASAVDTNLDLSPDALQKYGVSGGGGYGIQVSFKAFDTRIIGERLDMNFIEYLRTCFRWAGFPGLEKENRLKKEEILFLTKDLLPF